MRGLRTARCCAWTLGLVVASSAAATTAHAQDTEPALWLVRDVPDAEAGALRDAVAESLGVSLVGPQAAADRLRERAAELGDDTSTERFEEALQRGRRAYLEFRLDEARQAYGEALEHALGSDRRTPELEQLARVRFRLALAALAAQRPDEARAELERALLLDGEMSPDRSIYGSPVFRELTNARRSLERARKTALRVDVAPGDAVVHVDGKPVQGGTTIDVPRVDPHLVMARKPGYRPKAIWVDAEGAQAQVDIVLERAGGALLASQALGQWRRHGDDEPTPAALRGDVARLVARALGASRIVTAEPDGDAIALALLDVDSDEPVRTASGGRVQWERHPFFVLAEALAGRTVQPPESRAPVSLAVSAPSRVAPGEPYRLRVTLDDPDARARELRVSCDGARTRREIGPDGTGTVAVLLDAPDREGPISCDVVAFDAAGQRLASVPREGERLTLEVLETDDGPTPGWLWGGIGAGVVAVGAAITAAVLATRDRDQVLEIDVPGTGASP